jgi:hypothetical protein
VRTWSSRLRVCGAVAAPVLATAFGWTPAAHAAGLRASLPAAPPPVSAAPAVATVHSVTQTVTGAVSAVTTQKTQVVAAAHHVATAVSGSSTTAPARTAPAAQAAAPTKRAVSSPRRHRAVQAATSAPKRHSNRVATGVAIDRRADAAAGPTAQVVPELPASQLLPGFLPGPSAGGGSGFALLLVALAVALSALAAPGLGRRLMPSLADGRDCALTLDLERPD